ncbi:MAG: 3,8-cyclase, partial [Pseudothermotoga sp.]|nr:3,8-cyclase [Pseudothermotoga sp.]
MQDFYERNIDYLRLSITDRCNHRCFYCTCNNLFLKEENLMTYDEVNLISQFFYELGIKCIRITGGEPLLRNDVVRIVKALSSRFTVSMTTNGSKLSQLAKDLKDAGLHSLNISLNSLKQETFYKITHARLKPVL